MSYIDKSDTRIEKTVKSLKNAMTKCLLRHSFKKITVLELCEEAKIGRATFYAHFNDKYGLLNEWLNHLDFGGPLDIGDVYAMTNKINGYLTENAEAVKNLMIEADYETLDIIANFVLRLFGMKKPKKQSISNQDDSEAIAIYNGRMNLKAEKNMEKVNMRVFFTGGILCSLIWQVNNYFPENNKPLNPSMLTIIEQFKKWFELA